MAQPYRALILVVGIGVLGGILILGIVVMMHRSSPQMRLTEKMEKTFEIENFTFLKNPNQTTDLAFRYITAKTEPNRIAFEAGYIQRAVAKTNLCGKWSTMELHAARKNDEKEFTYRFTRPKPPTQDPRRREKPKPPTAEELLMETVWNTLRKEDLPDIKEMQIGMKAGLLQIAYTTDAIEGFRNKDAEAVCRAAGARLGKNGRIELLARSASDATVYRYRYHVKGATFSGPEPMPPEKSSPAPRAPQAPKEPLKAGQ